MIEVKIGRHKYEITEDDEFMDNGACVQLISQSMEKGDWGRRPNPILSKKAIKEIAAYDRVQLPHSYGGHVQVFTLAV